MRKFKDVEVGGRFLIRQIIMQHCILKHLLSKIILDLNLMQCVRRMSMKRIRM